MTREELLVLIGQTAEEGWKKLDLSGKGLTELPPEIGKSFKQIPGYCCTIPMVRITAG